MSFHLIHAPSDEGFAAAAAMVISQAIRAAIAADGRCVLGLSGGTTPGPVYEALSREPLPWEAVSLCLIDERCVAPGHPQSNQALVRRTLLGHLSVPPAQITMPDTTLSPESCAHSYGAAMTGLLQTGGLHVVTLGLGEDGHIASLFPPLSPAIVSTPEPVLATVSPCGPVSSRISLSLSCLRTARQPIFLLKGEAKRQVWEDMLQSPTDFCRWPAQAMLATGNATVVVDWA